MKIVEITSQYQIAKEAEEILSCLLENKEIIFDRDKIFSFESKDTTEKFQLIDIARLEEKGFIFSKLTGENGNGMSRKYTLTSLGEKIAKQIQKG